MKVLVTSGDFKYHLTPAFHYLLEELSKLVDLTVWYQPGDIHHIISRLGFNPDFIYINEYGETNSPKITGLADLSIPFAVSLHDLHYQVAERNEALRQDKVEHIISIGRDKFYEWYPEHANKLYWLPHHINSSIFKDYAFNKDIDFLMMGAVHSRVYPLRYKILNSMCKITGFVYHEHPGYRLFKDDDRSLVHEKYAREVNRAKLFLTCGSVWNYPLAKYYEVLACNTLLLAPICRELGDLGFIPGIHYVDIDENNFIDKAEYYLRHEAERLTISRQGYEMVHAQHSTTHRARELVNQIEGILHYHS